MNIISTEGYRQDGRKADELRFIDIKHSIINNKSTLQLDQGCTKVISTVLDMKEKAKPKYKLDLKVKFLADFNQDRNDMCYEMEQNVLKIFEPFLILPKNFVLEAEVVIKQDDGSLLTTIVNSLSLNFCICGVAMTDTLVAVSTGCVLNKFIIDLTASEEGRHPRVALGSLIHREKIGFIKEIEKIDCKKLIEMIDIANSANKMIFASFEEYLKNKV